MTETEYQNLVAITNYWSWNNNNRKRKKKNCGSLKKSVSEKRETKKQKQKRIQEKQKWGIETKKTKKSRFDSHSEESGSDEYEFENDIHYYVGSYDNSYIDSHILTGKTGTNWTEIKPLICLRLLKE